MMYNNLGYGHIGGFGFLGLIFMFIFWVAIIWLIVILIRNLSRHDHKNYYGTGHDQETDRGKQEVIQPAQPVAPEKNIPLEILKERYAKGEIGKGEFEEKKKDIM